MIENNDVPASRPQSGELHDAVGANKMPQERESDDLVKRLRTNSAIRANGHQLITTGKLEAEAADEIERLESRLRAAEARSAELTEAVSLISLLRYGDVGYIRKDIMEKLEAFMEKVRAKALLSSPSSRPEAKSQPKPQSDEPYDGSDSGTLCA